MNRTRVWSLLTFAGREIRKRLVPIAMIIAAVLMLVPPPAALATPQYETVYTVWYNNDMVPCMIGPPHPPSIEGEWTSGCHNEWYGWGWQPTDPCAYTVQSQGESCQH